MKKINIMLSSDKQPVEWLLKIPIGDQQVGSIVSGHKRLEGIYIFYIVDSSTFTTNIMSSKHL